MYSLDINFVRNRPQDDRIHAGARTSRQRVGSSSIALYSGLAIGLLLPALAGSGWFYLQNRNTQLEQENAQLEAQLQQLGLQEQEIKQIQEQTNQIKAQTQALATVFNQIRPWSATLQDLGDRIPTRVQIETIKQTAAAAQGENGSAPNSRGGIEISGVARSYSDVNDFLLTLQQSPFFNQTQTKIVTAELFDAPVAASAASTKPGATTAPIKPPQLVRYTIQSTISDAQASELLRELERKGTLGLVTRIRALQQKGVIQQ